MNFVTDIFEKWRATTYLTISVLLENYKVYLRFQKSMSVVPTLNQFNQATNITPYLPNINLHSWNILHDASSLYFQDQNSLSIFHLLYVCKL
jgi:hypothetical protein